MGGHQFPRQEPSGMEQETQFGQTYFHTAQVPDLMGIMLTNPIVACRLQLKVLQLRLLQKENIRQRRNHLCENSLIYINI